MIRSVQAELVKLIRRRFLALALLVATVFATAATSIVVLLAETTPAGRLTETSGRLVSVESLSEAGGGTAVFTQISAFGGVFLLAVFIATVAGEFTKGTFRTMLLQQPARGRVLLGKMVAQFGFAAVLTFYAQVVAWLTARLLAPGQGIDTSQWTTGAALSAGAEDLGRILLFTAGWAAIATMVGVLTRSVAVGVGAALVWFGPIENVVGDGWSPAEQYFPGLVLRSLITPDSAVLSAGRSAATVALYAAIAVGVATIALSRRDVTS